MEDQLIYIHHKGRTGPSLWGGPDNADSGKQRLLLPTPLLLPWCPRAPGHLHTWLSSSLSDFTSLSVSLSFSEGNCLGATSPERTVSMLGCPLVLALQVPKALFYQRVSRLWPSQQVPIHPFNSLTLEATFHHHPLHLLQGARLGCSHYR